MTTRVHYAAAALQGLLSGGLEGFARGLSDVQVADYALELADKIAAVACERWGHDYTEGKLRKGEGATRRWCKRCGYEQRRSCELDDSGYGVEFGEWQGAIAAQEAE